MSTPVPPAGPGPAPSSPAPGTPPAAAAPAQPSLLQRAAVYSKAITGIVALVLTGAVAEYGTSNKWVVLAIGIAGALGIYAVPNAAKPKGS